VWRITERLSFEEAASVSLCGLTAAQALFYRLGLASPFTWAGQSDSKLIDEEGAVCFFIYGASTSVGLYAAQLVRRSAEAHDTTIKLFGAASPSNFDMLKAPPYEYDHLVDYHDAKWPEQVLRYTDGAGVHFAYDCISEGTSVSQVCHSLRSGGKMAVVRSRAGGAWMADDLATEPIYGAVWEGLGVEVQYQGMTVPESLEARDFAVSFYMWLSNGAALQPNPIRLMPGGLESVVADGFALLGPGLMKDRAQGRTEAWLKPVSAEKLVYKI
jgi:NADPH:quinone reductase-like Zn-dependent oxidoreductase